MCLGLFLLQSNFFGTLWASWTFWKSISFARLGKFSFIICLNKFSIFCSSSSPSGTLWFGCWSLNVVPEVPNPLLIFLNSGFFILFQLNIYFFLLFQIIALSPSFLSFTVSSLCIYSFIFQLSSINSVSILITIVLNSASDMLAISLSLSSFSGVLICFFIWAIFLCLSKAVML